MKSKTIHVFYILYISKMKHMEAIGMKDKESYVIKDKKVILWRHIKLFFVFVF